MKMTWQRFADIIVVAILLLILTAIFIAMVGCTLLAPERELRFTEFDGDGTYLYQVNGAAKGFRLTATTAEPPEGCVIFKGQSATYISKGCPEIKIEIPDVSIEITDVD